VNQNIETRLKKRQRIQYGSINIFNLFLVVGFILIWSSEITKYRDFRSLPFMVALVIATKELSPVSVGAFYRASTRPYQVGRLGSVLLIIEGEVTDS